MAYLSFIDIFYRRMQNSKFSFYITIIILFLFSFLRFEVGADWNAYLAFYTGEGPVDKVEIGYRTLNNLIASFDFPYFIFLALISMLTLSFIYFVGISTKYKMIFLFVYFSELFLYYNFSGIRQGVAIAITLFATKYIFSREFYKFIAMVFLACTFHISAIIYIIAYFVYSYKFTQKNFIFIFILLFFLVTFLNEIVEFILSFLDSGKLYYYLAIAEVNENNTTNYIIGILKRSIILIIFFLIPNHLKNSYRLSSYIKIYLVGYFLYIITYTLNEDIGSRLSSYFLFMDVLIISIFFQLKINVRYKLMIFFTIFAMYMYKLFGYSQLTEYSYKVFL